MFQVVLAVAGTLGLDKCLVERRAGKIQYIRPIVACCGVVVSLVEMKLERELCLVV
jgi:hypothetical protein